MGEVGFAPGVFKGLPKSLFRLGMIVMTRGVAAMVAEGDDEPRKKALAKELLWCLARHGSGDWGDMDKHDKAENEFAIGKHLRIFSAYVLSNERKVWVITEADRSATTVLFPSEY